MKKSDLITQLSPHTVTNYSLIEGEKLIVDVSDIVNAKLAQMEGDGVIEKAITETLETTLKKAVVDALDSWKIKSAIQDKVSQEVSTIVTSLDFTTYNSFIAEKVKETVNGVCRADLCDKIEHMVSEMFLCKRDNVKLSEIFKLYRDYVCSNVDDADKYSRERFYVRMEEDPTYHWITVTLHEDPGYTGRPYSGDADLRFSLHKRSDGTAYMGTVYLNGVNAKEKIKFGHLNDAELLVIQAMYNDIPVILDVEDETDIDDTYDVDI